MTAAFQRRSRAWFQVPCTKQWLQTGKIRLIPFGRVSSHAQLGRCSSSERKHYEPEATATQTAITECAAQRVEANAAEAKEGDVFRGSAGGRA